MSTTKTTKTKTKRVQDYSAEGSAKARHKDQQIMERMGARVARGLPAFEAGGGKAPEVDLDDDDDIDELDE